MGLPAKIILGPDGRPARTSFRAARAMVRARYDAAQTTPENARHWAEADALSARTANSPDVRQKLRTRARYETANNSYAKGMVETIANDTIGTGPRLQLLSRDSTANREIERAFAAWADAIGLADKLRVMRKARAVDGEAFALLASNPKLKLDVKLDVRLVEADQVATPFPRYADPYWVDGIELDESYNPTRYHLLKSHPGDALALGLGYDAVPARLVIHWFRADRPGQYRGIPDITPALPLFAYLRRYTLATIAAAETAANFAAVLQSTLAPDADGYDADPFESLEIIRGMMTTLPAGWSMNQLKAEHPTTTYKDFKSEILREIARSLNLPYNIAAGDSSGYNYSSGRLDHQTYFKALGVDQHAVERVILDPLLDAWLVEAKLATDLALDGFDPAHQWFWDGPEHVDPEKEANAQGKRLSSRTTTYSREFARQGLDWETELRQYAREQELMRELGILPAEAAAPAPKGPSKPDPPTDGGGPADPADDSADPLDD